MWISRPGESLGSLATRLILWGDRDMELDLIYYRRRMAEELAAARSAAHPAVRAAHRELGRLYEDRIADLQAGARRSESHLVTAA